MERGGIESARNWVVGDFAHGCHAGGITQFALLSAAGSTAKSRIRYVRVMGLKEETVQGIGFKRLSIFRPGIIAGNAHTPSYVAWLLSLFTTVHEQDAARDFAVVFATAVERGNFPPFPQILIEEIQHLAILSGTADKHKQEQLHQPSRRFLDTGRRVGERELDQGIDVPLLGELLRIPASFTVRLREFERFCRVPAVSRDLAPKIPRS